MSIDLLKQNIEREKEIIKEISMFSNKKDYIGVAVSSGISVDVREKSMIHDSINSLLAQLRIINNALPDLIENISFYKKIDDSSGISSKLKESKLVNLKYLEGDDKRELNLTIKKRDEKEFLKEATQHYANKNTDSNKEHSLNDSLIIVPFIRTANKLFLRTSTKIAEKHYSDSLRLDLRKITSQLIVTSYISIALFSTLLSFIFSLIVGIILAVSGLSIGLAFLAFLLIPCLVFLVFMKYPSSRRSSLEKEINHELPFLTIYMAAIATSGLEPSKIFSIIGSSKDYPFVKREIKKLTNYINFYGYDLISALRAVSKNNPSEKLAQLLDGMSTTITSGGDLTEFLSKHSDTLLFDYRLEREKYTRVTETLMNIYISLVIAAPMIMMIILITMSLTSFGGDFLSPANIGLITIFIIAFLNIGFLLFLNLKQPKF